MRSVIVKYDLPPYYLVFKVDRRETKWEKHIPTEVGYFHEDSIVAEIDRDVGDRLQVKLNNIKEACRRKQEALDHDVRKAVNRALEEEGVK